MYTRLGQRQPKGAGPSHGQQRTPESQVRFVEGVRDVISKARRTAPRKPIQQHLPVYQRGQRHYDMLGMIASYPVLRHASECIRLKGEIAGQDRGTYYAEIQSSGINDYLRELGHALKEGRYEFSPLRRVEIPKAGNGKRTLDIPTIKDRVVENAMAGILYEWCSPTWSASSMGFRKGVSHQDVMVALQNLTIPTDRCIWLSTDIADAFGSIPHRTLLEIVNKEVPHAGLQTLIEQWLRSDSWINQNGKQGTGIPQGSPLSPLMINVFLNHALDQKLEKEGIPFIRYVDDLLFPCHSKDEANQTLQQVKALLQPWGLKLKDNKTIIEDARQAQVPYIGFLTSIDDGKLKLDIDAQRHIHTELHLRATMNSDSREHSVKIEDQTEQAKMVIEGWLQHFAPGISNGILDQIIKGIKSTLMEMNVQGVQTPWIKDIWKRSRERWDQKIERAERPDPTDLHEASSASQLSPTTPQASSRNNGVPAIQQPHPKLEPTRPARENYTQHDDTAASGTPFSPTYAGSDHNEGRPHQTQQRERYPSPADTGETNPSLTSDQEGLRYVPGTNNCSSKYDAARGMTNEVVQHAALWLFDGSEVLPAPVAVLDPSAPRRPGPMDQDWALTIV